MGILNVAQSLFSVSCKVWRHIPFWQPAFNLGASGRWLYAPILTFLVFGVLFIWNRNQWQHGSWFKWVFGAKWLFFIAFVALVLCYLMRYCV
jgi:hypothetical protein